MYLLDVEESVGVLAGCGGECWCTCWTWRRVLMYLLDVEESVDQCTCWVWRRVLVYLLDVEESVGVLAQCGGECWCT